LLHSLTKLTGNLARNFIDLVASVFGVSQKFLNLWNVRPASAKRNYKAETRDPRNASRYHQRPQTVAGMRLVAYQKRLADTQDSESSLFFIGSADSGAQTRKHREVINQKVRANIKRRCQESMGCMHLRG
jgi:hypothetical protein